MPEFRSIALYVCAVLLVVLGLSTWHYRALAKTTGLALQVQNAAVVATNTAAQQTPARPVGYFRKLVLDALQTP